jgi:hypothetical protein
MGYAQCLGGWGFGSCYSFGVAVACAAMACAPESIRDVGENLFRLPCGGIVRRVVGRQPGAVPGLFVFFKVPVV